MNHDQSDPRTKRLSTKLQEWHRLQGAPGIIELYGSPASCKQSIHESFRWGEAHLDWEDEDHLCIAVALSHNQHLMGGALIRRIPLRDTAEAEQLTALRHLGEGLLQFLIEENEVNSALMVERRHRQRAERVRAEGIHEWKLQETRALRRGFAWLEPELVMAIRRQDRAEARKLLNALIMQIYNAGQGDLKRVGDLIAELLCLMRLTARECGANEESHPLLQEPVAEHLARMEDEEELSPWLHHHLEGMFDAISSNAVPPGKIRARRVLDYMRLYCNRKLSRAEVAGKTGLSEAEFSRMMKRETGHSFSTHLLQLRIDRASRALRESGKTVEEIGYDCGFESPAYFSRAFKKIIGLPPKQYRLKSLNVSQKDNLRS